MEPLAIHVLFIHGLEGSPEGRKARLLRDAYSAICLPMGSPPKELPALREHFEACVAIQATEIKRRTPDVLVGSSFGGAIAAALLSTGVYAGPALLLCPAVQFFVPDAAFSGEQVLIAHGRDDALIPPSESEALAKRTGARFVATEDGHSMKTFAEHELVRVVRELAI